MRARDEGDCRCAQCRTEDSGAGELGDEPLEVSEAAGVKMKELSGAAGTEMRELGDELGLAAEKAETKGRELDDELVWKDEGKAVHTDRSLVLRGPVRDALATGEDREDAGRPEVIDDTTARG